MTTIKPDPILLKHLREKLEKFPGRTQYKLTGTISAYLQGGEWVFFTTMY